MKLSSQADSTLPRQPPPLPDRMYSLQKPLNQSHKQPTPSEEVYHKLLENQVGLQFCQRPFINDLAYFCTQVAEVYTEKNAQITCIYKKKEKSISSLWLKSFIMC